MDGSVARRRLSRELASEPGKQTSAQANLERELSGSQRNGGGKKNCLVRAATTLPAVPSCRSTHLIIPYAGSPSPRLCFPPRCPGPQAPGRSPLCAWPPVTVTTYVWPLHEPDEATICNMKCDDLYSTSRACLPACPPACRSCPGWAPSRLARPAASAFLVLSLTANAILDGPTPSSGHKSGPAQLHHQTVKIFLCRCRRCLHIRHLLLGPGPTARLHAAGTRLSVKMRLRGPVALASYCTSCNKPPAEQDIGPHATR